MGQNTPILQASAVSKSFGAVRALHQVDFWVNPAEVIGLIGDNGAGKSTLINILTGVFRQDEGELIFEGQEVHLHGPQDARHLGIETVYQDLAIAPHLDSVANMYLGREERLDGILGKMGFLDNKAMTVTSADQLKRLKVRIPDPTHDHTIGRAAAGSGGGPLGDVGQQGGDHGRADCCARRGPGQHGPRADRRGAQFRHPGGLREPQHAARLRGERPDRGAAARRGRGASRSEGAYHRRRGGADDPGISTTDQRQQGFEEAIAEFPDIEYLGAEYNNDDPTTAASQTSAILQAHPDLAGIFGTNLFGAEGAATAVREAGLQGQVRIVGFDAGPRQVAHLEQEIVDVLIAQHPYDIGYTAVNMAVDYLETGEAPAEKVVTTGYSVVTRDNMDEPDVARYLYVADCSEIPPATGSPEATPEA